MALGMHKLKMETLVPGSMETVFDFFSSAENLERITPPELGFKILNPLPIKMEQGTLIDYRIRLFGIPLKWQTLISKWEPKRQFVDEQLKGPYAQWVHTHSFEATNNGILMRDEVNYRLPFFPFGEVMLPVVRLQLRRIFSYRTERIKELI
jgi:ligand-binding SRPBCC domain-containing protein